MGSKGTEQREAAEMGLEWEESRKTVSPPFYLQECSGKMDGVSFSSHRWEKLGEAADHQHSGNSWWEFIDSHLAAPYGVLTDSAQPQEAAGSESGCSLSPHTLTLLSSLLVLSISLAARSSPYPFQKHAPPGFLCSPKIACTCRAAPAIEGTFHGQ